MSRKSKNITVFEHQRLDLGVTINGVKFDKDKFEALERYYGKEGVPYYSLTNKGIKFNEYVGVIQIGKTVIEVLPKADKNNDNGDAKQNRWRDILTGMLLSVGLFDIKSPSSSSLRIKPNSILDLYFELFLNEVDYLMRQGLIKQYRKKEGNMFALKGNLRFGQHIQQNLTHQERFYVRYTAYDTQHKLHYILYKAIKMLQQVNTKTELQSRIGSLILNFPEMPDIAINESTFEKIVYTRKTQPYQKAIEIARLLLLHYHPDLITGRNHVLALMFDMNKLWERFVYVSLRKNLAPGNTITAQTSKYFWTSDKGTKTRIRPDIVINKEKDDCVVLDTKWKLLKDNRPSDDDLKQMFVYHEYYKAKKVALVYPGVELIPSDGKYNRTGKENSLLSGKKCSVIPIKVISNIRGWQGKIKEDIWEWVEKEEELCAE